jgi:hypothetical protein
MNKALVIEDLDMNQELDRAALAQIVGGRNSYATGSWAQSYTGPKLSSSWKHNAWTGRYYQGWAQQR